MRTDARAHNTRTDPGARVKRRSDEPRVLVTGATGHLGANLVRRLLADGHRIRVLLRGDNVTGAIDNLDVERIDGDLRDLDSVRRAVSGCAHIYHCAAKVSTVYGDAGHQREIYDCNVIGTQNLLRAARGARGSRGGYRFFQRRGLPARRSRRA